MAQIVKRKNKNGSTSYLFRVSTGYDRNGKQVTTSRTFTPPPTLTGRKLEKEVRRRADEFEREVHNGLALDANMKLDDLIDRWFSEYIDKKCKPKTGVEYRYLRPRISAALGHMRVSQMRPSHLMAFYSSLEEAGARRDSVYLATPALHDVPPQYSAMVQLGLFTGMRRGEICGLRWSDIDFNASTISVNRTVEYIPHEGLIFTAPKTKASNRTFKVGANCMDMLREYQLYQKAERLRVGSMWARTVQVENGKTVQNDLLFTSWDGTPFDLERLTTWFPHFLRAHDLPAVHFHSLRHTYASLMIAAHVPITTVSGRLGHAQTSTTTDIYAGFIRTADAAASDAMEIVFDNIREKSRA